MNSKAATASMTVGIISYILFGELIRWKIVSFPTGFDNFYLAIILSILTLMMVGYLTTPSEYELQYYQKLKNAKLSTLTIRNILKNPNGLAQLKREYKQTFIIAISFIVISVVLWGYFLVKLGM